jgi:hypothetical protein
VTFYKTEGKCKMRHGMRLLAVAGAALASVLTLTGPADAAPAGKIILGPVAKSTCVLHAKWEGRCVFIRKSNEIELETGWYVVS